MNKKQFIVIWSMAVLVSLLILFAPKFYVFPHPGGYYRVNKPIEGVIVKIQWDIILQRSLIVIILGGLLIYTLKDKKHKK